MRENRPSGLAGGAGSSIPAPTPIPESWREALSRAKTLGNGRSCVCLTALMGHAKGKDNVKTRIARRKKAERIQAAKLAAKK